MTSPKVFFYMLFAWLLTGESSIYLSRGQDHKMAIEGSIRLVSEAIYLVLRIPGILIYCSFLKLLPGEKLTSADLTAAGLQPGCSLAEISSR